MESFIVGFWAKMFDYLRWISWFQYVRMVVGRKATTFGFVDAWVLSNLVLSILFLGTSSLYRDSFFHWVPATWGMIRVFEVFIYQVNVVFFDAYRADLSNKPSGIHSYRRIILLVLHNYVELIIWFGLFYTIWGKFFQGESAKMLDTMGGALYFSVVTMSTLGFGDIHPCHLLGQMLVCSQVVVSLFLTLVILAGFISYLPQRGTLAEIKKH